MVGGLESYEVKNKEIFENLRKKFSGIGFFRHEENKYYIKIQKKYVKEFLELNLITKL
jgi:hypothetical protein